MLNPGGSAHVRAASTPIVCGQTTDHLSAAGAFLIGAQPHGFLMGFLMHVVRESVGLWRVALLVASVMAAAMAGVGAAPEIEDPVRLTRRPVEPLAQALELTLDPAADGFSGRTIVDLIAHAPARVVRLHARDLELGAIALVPRAGGVPIGLRVERGELGLLTITTEAELAPGNYRLEIAFSGKYRRDGVGLYKTEFEGAPYLFTQLEARYGRLAFPSWDEPEFKHPWQVTLTVPEGLRAYANAEVVYATRGDGWQTLAFARTPPMPTYLVAVAVGPFEEVPVEGMSVPGRIITARGQSGLAGAIAQESPRILATLEDYFGIPYLYGKLDQIAVPEFTFGGMENAGLITYRDETILRPPGEADESMHRGLVQIVAHEMAHHWYGNLVTMEWWNDLWLNESFASWMEGKVLNTAYPELRYGMHAIGGKQRAMRIDALPSTGPVRRAITASDDPEKFVDGLSYEKGEAVLTMIESWIGPEAFRAAMKRYFEAHRWGSTRGEHLWAAFGAESGDDVPALVASFIEQPGVPQVSLEVLPGDRVRIRQKRYAALGGSLPAGAEQARWQVPMVLKFAVGPTVRTQRVLVREREQIVAVPEISRASWVFPNSGESGYYRWQLESARESTLAERAREVLEPVERLGFLLNAAAMHEAGTLAADRYLAYLVAFAGDPVPDVAMRAVDALLGLRAAYLDDADEAMFGAFCRQTLRPILDRIGMRPVAGEASDVAALRRKLIIALGARGSDPEVIAFARDLVAQLLRDPRAVDASLAEAALDVAAWHGDASLFAACERAFREARVPTDRAMFLAALGSFRDASLCDRALALALGDGLRSHERLVIPWMMSGASLAHRAKVVDWMIQQFESIRALTSEHGVSLLIVFAEGPDPQVFARARAFLREPGRSFDAAEKVIAEASDRDAQRQALRAWGRTTVRRALDLEVRGGVSAAP